MPNCKKCHGMLLLSLHAKSDTFCAVGLGSNMMVDQLGSSSFQHSILASVCERQMKAVKTGFELHTMSKEEKIIIKRQSLPKWTQHCKWPSWLRFCFMPHERSHLQALQWARKQKHCSEHESRRVAQSKNTIICAAVIVARPTASVWTRLVGHCDCWWCV